MPLQGHLVLQEARAIARRILGSYNPDLAIIHCKFGRKSSIGCSLSLAYIDEKLSNLNAFTGSSQCTRWFFNQVLPGDKILNEMVVKLGVSTSSKRLMHESLNLISVPKSWKTYRSITPLTLLSLFYSYGVGQLVTDRLRENGLDIRRLQNRHRHLVKGFSKSLTHATADLSAASDSITMELLNRILPREWFRVIKRALTHQIRFKRDGLMVDAYTESVLPMGNGLTFPVETLVFYSIIKAIGNLVGATGLYSVYGDDLIYPSRIHKYVRWVFPAFNLVLNDDKTFVNYPFRESCGSDFYRGCDVRPFFLQGERQLLTPSKYQAFLYKTINGLVRRWHPLEVRQTLVYLYTELALASQKIFRVPPDFPDTAGIKVDSPWDYPLGLENLDWSPISVICDGDWNGKFRFSFLSETPGKRYVKTVLPYYWLALQGLDDEVDESYSLSQKPKYPRVAKRSSLQWEKHTRYRRYSLHGKSFTKKLVSFRPYVASRVRVQHQIRVGTIYEWY
jgi:hypothetical protein